MTNLRKRMLEEFQRRNYSPATIRGYLLAVEQFAKHFGKSPDKPGSDELRSYQAYLLAERKLAVGSVVGRVAALRFFFVRTLKRREFWEGSRPSLITRAATGTARSVRPRRASAGSRGASGTCFPCPTSTSSLLCLMR